nr:MAG TPA: hypothetical protein [Caudoviricetes sp.]
MVFPFKREKSFSVASTEFNCCFIQSVKSL